MVSASNVGARLAGACDAGPANFTIITDGNSLFGGNVYCVPATSVTMEPARQSPAPIGQIGLIHRCITPLASIPSIVSAKR